MRNFPQQSKFHQKAATQKRMSMIDPTKSTLKVSTRAKKSGPYYYRVRFFCAEKKLTEFERNPVGFIYKSLSGSPGTESKRPFVHYYK